MKKPNYGVFHFALAICLLLSILSVQAQPINDEPCDAIEVECGQIYSASTFSATESELSYPECSVPFFSKKDVFYKITAYPNVSYVAVVQSFSGGLDDGVLAVYTGECGGSLTEIGCAFDEGGSGSESLSFSVDNVQEVIIRTYDWEFEDEGGGGGSFQFLIDCEPINNSACDALPIECGETLNGASSGGSSSGIGAPSCSAGSFEDVFYTFNALPGFNYQMIVNGPDYDAVLSVYSGSCNGTLTELACADEGVFIGIQEVISFSVDEEMPVLIRTYDWADSQGSFNISLSCTEIIDCQLLGLNIGDPCDDGNPDTNFDSVSTDCECVGIAPCLGDTEWDSATLSGSNEVMTISTANLTGDFSPIFNATIGNQYTFVSADNSGSDLVFITIRSGTVDGAVLGSGFSPLTITSDINGTLFAHFSADQLCDFMNIGTFTSTVQCITCPIYCPELDAIEGNPCDDGNPETINDTVTNDCNCLGQLALTGSLSGSAEWNMSCGDRGITIDLYAPGTSTQLYTFNTTLNQNGDFDLGYSIVAGSYDIYAKIDGRLSTSYLNESILQGDNTLLLGSSVSGDINNNNGINITDFSLLNISFGSSELNASYNNLADMNCDGNVNIIDVSILNIGFGMVGDTP